MKDKPLENMHTHTHAQMHIYVQKFNHLPSEDVRVYLLISSFNHCMNMHPRRYDYYTNCYFNSLITLKLVGHFRELLHILIRHVSQLNYDNNAHNLIN
uniref:Uncharacterized protein n=1 Tax=Octopus bimaculoides TaxID=37653 RepID=A0A0L8HM20_OCTBM